MTKRHRRPGRVLHGGRRVRLRHGAADRARRDPRAATGNRAAARERGDQPRHVMTNIVVEPGSDGTARVRSYLTFTVTSATGAGVLLTATYEDEVVRGRRRVALPPPQGAARRGRMTRTVDLQGHYMPDAYFDELNERAKSVPAIDSLLKTMCGARPRAEDPRPRQPGRGHGRGRARRDGDLDDAAGGGARAAGAGRRARRVAERRAGRGRRALSRPLPRRWRASPSPTSRSPSPSSSGSPRTRSSAAR